MKEINLSDYFYTAIKEGLHALSTREALTINYYNNNKECTIDNFFCAQMSGKRLFDHTELFNEETLIVRAKDYKMAKKLFEEQRSKVWSEYIDNILDEIES